MNILIIEDETRIARRLQRMTRAYFGDRLESLTHRDDLAGGRAFLAEHPVELLLLDLNLNGANGFDILRSLTAAAFDTVIVSAYQDRAIEAFEYGVLDFVPKPFSRERLFRAFDRLRAATPVASAGLRHLAVRKRDGLHLLPVAELSYVRGAGDYAELVLRAGATELHSKTLDQLARLLPERFFRLHRSYLVDLAQIRELRIESGGKYTAVLHSGEELPVGRTRVADLRERLA
jgi:two-component system response regulator LytT